MHLFWKGRVGLLFFHFSPFYLSAICPHSLTFTIYLSPQFTIDLFPCPLSFPSIPFTLVPAFAILLKKLTQKNQPHHLLWVTPTNSSQSDTLQVKSSHSCKVHTNNKIKVLNNVEIGLLCLTIKGLNRQSLVQIQ